MPNPFDKYLTPEDHEHIMVVKYMKSKHPDLLFFHVPNEGKKSAFERYKTSIMGAKKGIADFLLLEPNNGKHGLFIELKAPSRQRINKNTGKIVKVAHGKPSPEQLDFIAEAIGRGYDAKCVIGADECIKIIEEYLS